MTHLVNVLGLLAAGALTAQTASAEVPVPRLSPGAGYHAASLDDAAATAADPLPITEAIRREVTVDVSLSVADFYAAHGFAPIWTPARAKALRARLADAERDGFDPADYFVPFGLSDAAAEVSLTEAALRYGRHATSGRVSPLSISRLMTSEPPKLDEAAFLQAIAETDDIAAVLDAASPQHPQFVALKAALGRALESRQDDRPAVGPGPTLKRGSQEVRVAVLRSRLGATVVRGEDPTLFDDTLDDAVRNFQRTHGLSPDGIVGPRTVGILDEGIGDDVNAALVSNMERWRWLPRDLGAEHVIVNVPAYRVRVVSGGKTTYEGRVIVGDTGHPTPIFSDEIEHVVVNPYWNVPISIASKEMLAGIQANPSGYFARRGYEVVYNGNVIDPGSLSWHQGMLNQVRIRQKPGRGNALGAVKFMFPNKHAVYLHDTPGKNLFDRSQRALSHGCVRVDRPFEFADALLAHDANLSGNRLRRLVGGDQRYLNLETPVPVHLTYFTREVRADGSVIRHADIYGYDARTQRALAE